jgi:hypothetical protein
VIEIAGGERGELRRERLGRRRGECGTGQIRDARRLLADGLRDLANAVADVGDEGAS